MLSSLPDPALGAILGHLQARDLASAVVACPPLRAAAQPRSQLLKQQWVAGVERSIHALVMTARSVLHSNAYYAARVAGVQQVAQRVLAVAEAHPLLYDAAVVNSQHAVVLSLRGVVPAASCTAHIVMLITDYALVAQPSVSLSDGRVKVTFNIWTQWSVQVVDGGLLTPANAPAAAEAAMGLAPAPAVLEAMAALGSSEALRLMVEAFQRSWYTTATLDELPADP